ncbi:MAG: redox-regulated ATPase YchF, partial [Vicinamibacterales bacterium]
MLHAALIGLPATGKSTLFQLMTSARDGARGHGKAETQVGVSKVPDARLDRLTAIFNPRKHIPATIEFTDVVAPGRTGATALIDLAGYKTADALVHVVRSFTDQSVAHPSGRVDPVRDAQAMEDELILADLGVVERRFERIDKDLKKNKSAELNAELELLLRCRAALENGQPLRALGLAGAELRRLRGFQLLSAKPQLIVINLDEADASAAANVDQAAARTGLAPFLSRAETRAVPVCARIELEIAALDPADAQAFLADLGLQESGLDRVIHATYELLGYISFFTVGDDECRAWSIPRGTVALDAAAEIHSDISRGFIRAEVVGYDAFIARGSLQASRDHGELRLEGKEYVVQD